MRTVDMVYYWGRTIRTIRLSFDQRVSSHTVHWRSRRKLRPTISLA